MTKYLMMIYADESLYADVTPEQWGEMAAQHGVFVKEVTARGATVLGGEGLLPSPTATTVRVNGTRGHTVTDGPFVETKENIGGYYLVEAADLDQAIELAKLCPAYNGGVEIRPVMETSGG